MAEGARLESVYRGNSIQGSNPCLSAIMSLSGPDDKLGRFRDLSHCASHGSSCNMGAEELKR